MMKRLYAVALMLAATALPVSAQGLEFSGGVNFAKLSGENISNAARNYGANLGLNLVLPLGPLGFNLGAGWSQKGVEADGTDPTVIDLSYIELPIHFRFPIVKAGPARLNVIAGPTIGINTGCKISIGTAPSDDCVDATAAGIDPKKVDWSGTGGLGFSLHVGGLAYAGIDLLYTAGLSSMNQLSEDLKNRAFTLRSHIGIDLF